MARPKKQIDTDPMISDKSAAFNLLASKHKGIGKKQEVHAVLPSDCLQSPSTQLNIMTNDGGFRPGSIIEVYGHFGTMKTSLALQLCRVAQEWKPDHSIAYYDPEQAVDLYVAGHEMGINLESFEDGRPRFDYWPAADDEVPTLEEILDRIYDVAASGIYSFVVLDSVAACMTLWEKEADQISDAKWGGPSIMMSKAMKRIKSVCSKTGTILYCVNQLRTKTIQTPQGLKSVEEPGSGFALRYAASHRFKLSWAQKDSEGDDSKLRIVADKVKYGRSWATIETPITLGVGINEEADLVLAAEAQGIIVRKGAWFSFQDSNIGNGLAKTAANLKAMPTLLAKIKEDTLNAALSKVTLNDDLINVSEEISLTTTNE
jgi:recombination protein RecA